MSFLSSIFQKNKPNVRDLLLVDRWAELPETDRDCYLKELTQMLNVVESVQGVARASEICDTIMLRRINDTQKIERHLLSKKLKPFVFLVSRN